MKATATATAFTYLLLVMMPASHVVARETAATSPTRYVEVDDNRIAYRSIGTGAAIVLANRLRGTLDTWDPLFLDALAKHRTVITFDYPGVGYSSGKLPDDMRLAAEFINDFTTALELDTYAVLGWSWGGLASQVLLLDQPKRVTHAIVVGANPPGAVSLSIQPIFLELSAKPVNDLADEEVLFFEPKSQFSLAAAKASHARIYARPGVVAKIPSKMEEFETYHKAAATFREDKLGHRQQLTLTRTPILIICGDNDIATPGQNWFPLVGKIPNAQLLIYPESGHGPQHQYPELSAEYIASFLARTAK